MTNTDVKIAIRSVIKQKLFSGINIVGLAVGITATMLIMMYVGSELSYDKHHPAADRTVRITAKGSLGGNAFEMTSTPAPLAGTLLADFPEVEHVTRVSGIGGFPVVRYGDKAFSEERWVAMDSTAFDVFDLELIYGTEATALTEPNTVMLSASTAHRYFGDADPIGETLNSDNRRDFTVSGVYKDQPATSHFHYDFIAALSGYPQQANNPIWVSFNYLTYVVLREGVALDVLDSKFPGMIETYVGPQLEQFMGVPYEKLKEQGTALQFISQPMTDIHLKSQMDGEVETNGSIAYVYTFSLIAIFILLLAAINYMNLATARSAERAKEVGVRKTLGSHRGLLIKQFLTESIVFALIATIVAAILIILALPWFNNLVGLRLVFNPMIMGLLIAIGIVVGVLAGIYPAFFLSSFNAAEVLLGSSSSSAAGSTLRSGLVIFQFTVSIVLFSSALLVNNQLEHMQNKPLGFETQNMLVVEKTDDIGADMQAFLKALDDNVNIFEVTNTSAIPGHQDEMNGNVLTVNKEGGPDNQLMSMMLADFNFANVYDLKMKSGRYFDSTFPTDSQAVVINEAAARAYGLGDNAVGTILINHGRPQDEDQFLEVLGVVEDFHIESLHREVRPTVILPMGINMFGGQRNFGKFVTAKVNPVGIGATLGSLEGIWKGFANDQALEYVFLDDHLKTLYAGDERTKAIMSVFTILAIFIASLGLLGLAAFSAEQRSKEIGIRKVLGASVAQIFVILSKDILSLVLIAVGVALPLSYALMGRWLEDFAYRVGISPENFLIAGMGALVIALITISYQVIRAAVSNPIGALRYE